MRSLFSLMVLPFGRASRVVFLAGLGALWVVMPLLTTLLPLARQAFGVPAGLPVWLVLLVSAWVLFCLFANRLHDLGRSALWAVIPILLPALILAMPRGFRQDDLGWAMILTMYVGPVLYFGFAILLLCFKGKETPNRFGERAQLV